MINDASEKEKHRYNDCAMIVPSITFAVAIGGLWGDNNRCSR
jgi:hypothetical protein